MLGISIYGKERIDFDLGFRKECLRLPRKFVGVRGLRGDIVILGNWNGERGNAFFVEKAKQPRRPHSQWRGRDHEVARELR
jgi:hypothetical protein